MEWLVDPEHRPRFGNTLPVPISFHVVLLSVALSRLHLLTKVLSDCHQFRAN